MVTLKNDVYKSHERVTRRYRPSYCLLACLKSHSRNLILLIRNDACGVTTLLCLHLSAMHVISAGIVSPLFCCLSRAASCERQSQGGYTVSRSWRVKRKRTSYWRSIDALVLRSAQASVLSLACDARRVLIFLFRYGHEPLWPSRMARLESGTYLLSCNMRCAERMESATIASLIAIECQGKMAAVGRFTCWFRLVPCERCLICSSLVRVCGLDYRTCCNRHPWGT